MRPCFPGPSIFAALLLVSIMLVSGSAGAQFDARSPSSVGVVILPFTLEYDEDLVLSARMEGVLAKQLSRRIGRAVYAADAVLPALEDGVAGCLADRHCIPFMGDQFNVSLVLHVSMKKTGEELLLEVDFYSTGNGFKIASKRVTLAVGDDTGLLRSFSDWIKELFEASLLINAESLAGEGGVIGGDPKEEERKVAQLEATRRKRKPSRRAEFQPEGEASAGFDRSDPAADLRAIARGDEPGERSVRKKDLPERRRKERSAPPRDRADYSYDGDVDLDNLDEETQPRSNTKRKPKKQARKKPIGLSASQDSGRSVRSYSDAQRAGLGVREYKRFTRTGLRMETFLDQRWAHGRRFHIRAGGYYGLGWLTRRYATIIYIPATNSKTEEYAWESLGFSAVNPGFSLGLGYAPVDFLEVELEVSVMLATQDLRNEYIWQGAEVPTNRGLPPRSQRTAHVLADLRARFFVNPMSRVKFSPGIGLTISVMGGYEIEDDGPLQYSPRPVAGLVGITPLIGMTAALSPFLSLYVDLLPTIILSRGAARYEELMFFNGETERVGLQESDLNPPLDGCGGSQGEGFSSCPLMFRVGVGTMIMF